MKKHLLLIAMMLLCVLGASAQRFTDKLNRGLIAMKTTSGVFVSWRIQADEYYDVKYNLYRNGTKIAENLNTSNFTDKSGTTSSTYQVAPVVNGVEKEKCDAVTALAQDYMDVIIKHDPSLKATYVPNDGCCVDVDGDGDVELLLKLDNSQEAWAYYQKEGFYNGTFSEYTLLECIEIIGKDAGKVLWWVNCGPNMGDFQNNEQNIVGYDWDQDGKGEVIMRLCEGAEVHMADGTTYKVGANGQNGTSWTNYRGIKYTGSGATTATIGYNIASGATVSSNADWCTAKLQNGNLVVSVTENTDTGNGRYATITVNESGKTRTFNFGQPKAGQSSVEWFTYYGNEYLYYCEGTTGKPYQCIEFPCKRLEAGETSLESAWGDGYGHRSNKFFYGAPYLDGRKPSMFIGRGIYTRHKFVALDVDPATHQLTERWRWYNNTNGPWKGQGYHNYAIVDVDWDGRDEIVWGSMVIDDNGKGLSTTGLGHGDAQHHGDLDPYRWGQEGFFCNEDKPTNNYRDLTTSKLYYRVSGSSDAGRAIAGNFSNKTPGSIGFSAHDNAISLVTDGYLSAIESSNMSQNFRCYWDGDLCEETFNYANGKNTEGVIIKYGKGVIKTLTGTMTNNDTKGTPTYMGDILGDWREEFIMRTSSNNLRIHSTTIETPWRNYSLWYDKQYRNGMVWEPCGYNQPPHASYFIGELEGITAAPPAETMTGRTEVANNGTIANSGESVITCETNDMTVAVADGATPYIYIDNAPSWVQGWAGSESSAANDPSKIKYTYYTHTLTGGAFAGDMRLVKQGEGTLVLPNVTQAYKGDTEVWGGALNFDGTLQNSHLWLNRHTALNSDGGNFAKGIKADYNSVIRPGGVAPKASSITTDNLELGFGAIVELELFNDGTADQLNTRALSIEKKTWQYGGGPAYDTPVFRIIAPEDIADGKYCIGTVTELTGSLDDILMEGLMLYSKKLSAEDGKLYLSLEKLPTPPLKWTGANSTKWDVNTTENFALVADASSAKFAHDSEVTFDDSATSTNVVVEGNPAPKSVVFENNSKAYTLSGESLVGDFPLVKNGKANVTIQSDNNVGSTQINEGAIVVNKLANTEGTELGNLGGVSSKITIAEGGMLTVAGTVKSDQGIISTGGTINVSSGSLTQNASISGSNVLTKTGSGSLTVGANIVQSRFNVKQGTVTYTGSYAVPVSISGTSSITGAGFNNSSINVEAGATAKFTTINRTTAANKLTGTGQLTVYCATEKGSNYYATRTPIQFNLSNFQGTIVAEAVYTADGNFTFDTSTGSDTWTLNIPASRRVMNSGKNLRIGKVTGSGNLGGTCSFSGSSNTAVNTWSVGNDEDFTFAGGIVDNARFVKLGSGKMTVTGKTSTATGTVTISEGSVNLQGGGHLGTGVVTVAAGAALLGVSHNALVVNYTTATNNPLTHYSYTINGTIKAGTSLTSTTGYLNIGNKNVTINNGGELRVGIKKASSSSTSTNCTTLLNIKKLTMNAGSKISAFLDASYVPTATETTPDEFYIFASNSTPSISADVVYDLPTLPTPALGHYYWDSSEIASGKLLVRYTTETAIAVIEDTESVDVQVVSTSGTVVSQFSTTMGDVRKQFAQMPLTSGVYLLRAKSDSGKVNTLKLTK